MDNQSYNEVSFNRSYTRLVEMHNTNIPSVPKEIVLFLFLGGLRFSEQNLMPCSQNLLYNWRHRRIQERLAPSIRALILGYSVAHGDATSIALPSDNFSYSLTFEKRENTHQKVEYDLLYESLHKSNATCPPFQVQ